LLGERYNPADLRVLTMALSNPRFLLTGDGVPNKGQEEIVFESLLPFQEEHTLEDLARQCINRGYMEKIQEQTGLFRLSSILFHLRAMRERGMVREV
jgi:hypothetical protein